MAPDMNAPLHLRAGGVSLILDDLAGMPSVLHWGADLGPLSDAELVELRLVSIPQAAPNEPDVPPNVGIVAEHASGWSGTPGLRGDRDGADWSPQFSLLERRPSATGVTYALSDAHARLGLQIDVEMLGSGLLRLRAAVRNDGASAYRVDGLELGLPVPARADELLDLTGRHARERSPQRRPFDVGAWLRDGLRGRTGTDATLLLTAGTAGFGFRDGEVWAVHVAWSGNHRSAAERVPSGHSRLGGGELLLPGEMILQESQTYTTPWLYAAYGRGLDEISARVHQHLRSRPQHPTTPRPVVLNTWEAVYFDHDLDALRELVDLAADVGVERFVLDDGWFHGRRHDRAGLGDWWVDSQVWPNGLHPLIDHVKACGMDFGIWVEPEHVNVDSDLARAHPEWLMKTGGRLPVESRHQHVLDLGNPAACTYVLERLDTLLTDHDIAYLKWDHNRDLVDAGSGPRGVAGVHAQTLAVYRLLDDLRQRHPRVEIESCSSGGGRIDLEILERTDRVWASDSNDALERQSIQRWTGLLVPPEMMGAHIGPSRAHTTSRTHDLSFRAGTALFGHLGIEWDLRTATPVERAELASWVALSKQLRGLLASGTVVRSDHADPALWVHGVVAADRSEAVYAVVAMATGVPSVPGRVVLPGLDPTSTYRVEPLAPGNVVVGPPDRPLPWWSRGATLTGSVLVDVGVQIPIQHPEHLVLVRASRLPGG